MTDHGQWQDTTTDKDIVEGQADVPAEVQDGPPTEIFEGQIINTLTGEVIGPALGFEKFEVRDEQSLERWMQMIGRAEDGAVCVESRPDVTAARALLQSPEVLEAQRIMRNVNGIRAAAEKRKAGLIAWQQAAVVETVRRMLAERKGKSKSIQTIYGTVGLTTYAPKLDVIDTDKALAFALMADAQDAYKTTYSVQKTPVKALCAELVEDWKATQLAVEALPDGEARTAAMNRLTSIQDQLGTMGCAVVGTQTKVTVDL